MLALLEDDTFLQILAACSEAHDGGSSLHADVPLFKSVKGLACSKGMMQRLHRLRPLVGTKSLAVVQRPALGPWRVVLLWMGVEVTEALVEQARLGRVRTRGREAVQHAVHRHARPPTYPWPTRRSLAAGTPAARW